jgi:spectinomycin phosphotransferase
MAIIKSLHATIGNRVYDNAFERQLAVFWQDHADEIGTIIEQTERLSHRLQQSAPDRVLCHADIHTANVLIDAQGQLFIVDWDEAILAPKERDLMFVTVGGFVTEERIESLFFQGYGKTQIDPLVMAYYRFERSMEDLAAFAERVFAADASDAVKQDSVEWFKRQFAPGGLIEAAYNLEHLLT